ncbi:AbiU2 domain-containing protein [Gluconacetobacter tumulicola]|uniref:HEPN AbiU2-like domain-containing protein n=1 Tax=Gluconacetobacter tumulicola TaxID=1017177 RepID=A0A7W4JFC1_9PROT|nr:hypothetical protein [Gluconacetobacter tumulicola]MBB2180123.1 hypothetical protein [Gluconacetobacter tumulicola]
MTEDMNAEIARIQGYLLHFRDEVGKLIHIWETYSYMSAHMDELNSVFSDRLSNNTLDIIMGSLVHQTWLILMRMWDDNNSYNENLRISFIFNSLNKKKFRNQLSIFVNIEKGIVDDGFFRIKNIYYYYIEQSSPGYSIYSNIKNIRNIRLAHRDIKKSIEVSHSPSELNKFYEDTIEVTAGIFHAFGLVFSEREYKFWGSEGAKAFLDKILRENDNV